MKLETHLIGRTAVESGSSNVIDRLGALIYWAIVGSSYSGLTLNPRTRYNFGEDFVQPGWTSAAANTALDHDCLPVAYGPYIVGVHSKHGKKQKPIQYAGNEKKHLTTLDAHTLGTHWQFNVHETHRG